MQPKSIIVICLAVVAMIFEASGQSRGQQPEAQSQPASRPISLADKIKICDSPRYPARISPDGKWVVWLDRTGNVTTYHLFNVQEKTDKKLHSLPAYVPPDAVQMFVTHGMWSADSKRFLVANECAEPKKLKKGADAESYCDLAVCDLEGKIVNVKRKIGAPYGGVFGPDGSIYWSNISATIPSDGSPQQGMYTGVIYRVSNTTLQQSDSLLSSSICVSLIDHNYAISYLTVSPDGSTLGAIAIQALPSGDTERRIWAAKFDHIREMKASAPLPLAKSSLVYGRWLFWSPDGKTLYAGASKNPWDTTPDGAYSLSLSNDDSKDKQATTQKTPTEEEKQKISRWIAQLGEDDYAKRLAAREMLEKNLHKAAALLADAKSSKDIEVAAIAAELLEKMSAGETKKILANKELEIADVWPDGQFSCYSKSRSADRPLLIDKQGDMGVFIENDTLIVARIVDPNAPASKPATPTSEPTSQKTESPATAPTTNSATIEAQ